VTWGGSVVASAGWSATRDLFAEAVVVVDSAVVSQLRCCGSEAACVHLRRPSSLAVPADVL
jgi:hypothetical protein